MKTLFAFIIGMALCTGSAWAKDLRTVIFKVQEMECQNCENKVKNTIKFEKGLKKFNTDLETKTVTITYDAEKTNIEQLQAGFKKINYSAEVVEEKTAE